MITVGLAVLKFAAILLAGLFGGLGLLVNYKDSTGRISKWGRVALVGIVISTLVAASTNGLEIYRSQQEAKQRYEQTTKLLRTIRSTLYRIGTIQINARFTIRSDDPELAKYAARIRPLLPRGARAMKIGDSYYQSIIEPSSPLYPQKDRCCRSRESEGI